MKTLKFTILFFLISIQLMAQVSIGFKVAGGGAVPMAPNNFKDNWKPGFGGGIGVTVTLLSILTVEGEADYFNFALDTDKLLKSYGTMISGVNVTGGSISTFTLMANLKYFLIPKVSPVTIYLFGGGGLTSMKIEDIKFSYMGISDTESGETETKPGAQAGVGIQAGLGSIGVFAEAKYVSIFTKDKNTAFAAVKAGLVFGL